MPVATHAVVGHSAIHTPDPDDLLLSPPEIQRSKSVKPRFSIIVHQVPTEDFDLDREKKEGIAKIMEENDLAKKGFKIEDIIWLKKKDRPLGRLASIGV
ncbi:hypothetical protein TSTA_107580 [Talaromyces stipitatus ATCC 10500]|uniref:Uncharacterized protein n=1 Tax=Talaromyces stipitatus (strain ATCC 10500 / CBS 375.48 / QM 6759 / NRRL 1006) TaxID=441959 RepID=B8MNA2_TALSN|nr:uncharacterized protein TSTA_107580 [Talaromyces stipitatus ATCC 10500]EED14551.1 hypothetical protein TSTA_107580 [Talaromyces stipitatus ATCC 10500]